MYPVSAKAMAGSILPFIDWDKALVEQVVKKRQEKIPLLDEPD